MSKWNECPRMSVNKCDRMNIPRHKSEMPVSTCEPAPTEKEAVCNIHSSLYRHQKMDELVAQLWSSKYLTDVKIITQNGDIFAHIMIISMFSEKLKKCYIDNPQICNVEGKFSIELKYIPYTVVNAVLECVYGVSELKPTDFTVEDMLITAEELGFCDITKLCVEFVKTGISKENCIQRLILADKYNLLCLTESCLDLAANVFPDIKENKKLTNLKKDTLNRILMMNNLAVEDEIDVLECINFWYAHQNNELLNTNHSDRTRISLELETTELVESCVRFAVLPGNLLVWMANPTCPEPAESNCEELLRQRIDALKPIVKDKAKFLAKNVTYYTPQQKEQIMQIFSRRPAEIMSTNSSYRNLSQQKIKSCSTESRYPTQSEHTCVTNEFATSYKQTILLGGYTGKNGEPSDIANFITHDDENSFCMMPRTTRPSLHRPPNKLWGACAVALPFRIGQHLNAFSPDSSAPRIQQLFICGGYSGSSLATTWIYDIEEEVWKEGPIMQVARSIFGLALDGVKGNIYAVGGFSEGAKRSTEVLSIKECPLAWKRMGQHMNVARWHCGAACVTQNCKNEECGYLYAVGGYCEDAKCSIEVLDLCQSNPQWILISRNSFRHNAPAVVSYYGELFIFGGVDSSCVESYSRESDRWLDYPSLPEPLHGAAITVVKDRAYLYGGVSDNKCLSGFIKCFDFKTCSWLTAPQLKNAEDRQLEDKEKWQRYGIALSF